MEEHFISYSCIFISYIQCFEVSFQKSTYFSKKLYFQNFDWSNLIFDQSKSFLKNSVSLCLVRLIEPVFRSIKHRVSSFLKNSALTDSNTFSKVFFIIFYLNFSRFFSLKAGRTILSLLLFLFSCFHAFFHAFKRYFRTFLILGFLLIQGYFSEIDYWVLLVYWYIHDCCWLIWSIWSFMKNWKF